MAPVRVFESTLRLSLKLPGVETVSLVEGLTFFPFRAEPKPSHNESAKGSGHYRLASKEVRPTTLPDDAGRTSPRREFHGMATLG